jgi:hypothetical protein
MSWSYGFTSFCEAQFSHAWLSSGSAKSQSWLWLVASVSWSHGNTINASIIVKDIGGGWGLQLGCVTYIYDILLLTINSYLITVPQSSSHALFLLSSLLMQATLFYLIAVDCYISKTTKNFWTFRHFLSLFACPTGQQVSTGLTGPTSMQVLNNNIINMIVYAFNMIILAFEKNFIK